MTVRIDALDRKILDQLQRDAGQSLEDIAREVGSSKTPVWNRIRKLREAGVIGQQTVLLDDMQAARARLSQMRATLIAQADEDRAAAAGSGPDIGEDAANLAALAIALDSSLPAPEPAPPPEALPAPARHLPPLSAESPPERPPEYLLRPPIRLS